MAQSFFFYDLETSGLDPKCQRIMQFAGQRTDLDFNPVGEPLNLLIKLTPEVLPEPMAVIVTGITPQATVEQGMTEREAVKRIMEEAFIPDTIVIGFNNISFDDEYIRYTAYRNFWDPYEWAYADGRSRWDLLDASRLVRALRPQGIEWPNNPDGSPMNTLVGLTTSNNLPHMKAHDALSDVEATIAVAKLLRDKQPRMFQYLFDNRGKDAADKIITPARPDPFVYAAGHLGKANFFTSVVVPVGYGDNKKVIVYDLRHDPTPYLSMTVSELRVVRYAKWEDRKKPGYRPLPASEIKLNECPAVAPLSTLGEADATRIGLNHAIIERHLEILQSSDLPAKLKDVFTRSEAFPKADDVDAALYDGFFGPSDKTEMIKIRRASANDLATMQPRFTDPRLPELFLRYKGRNDSVLSSDDRAEWSSYIAKRRAKDDPKFTLTLDKLASHASSKEKDLITKLKQWKVLISS